MFEKVLFPTDFSDYARKILECIGEIPGIKKVFLLHIVDATHPSKRGWVFDPEIEKAKIYLEEDKKFLENLGLETETKVKAITAGDVPRAIMDTADEEKVSLVVMGARGKSLIKEILLGSVSANVLRHGKTHLLIMRHKVAEGLKGEVFEKFCPRIFSKVLFPTDFSKTAGSAFSFVKGLKGIEEMVLVHVIRKGETKEEIEERVQEAKKKLEVLGKELKRAGIKNIIHVHLGDPPEEINRVAEEEDCSLIAIGPYGKGILREVLKGSVTCAVVRRTKRPVLVVRT